MLAKISSENVQAIGAKDAAEFDVKLTKFIADSKLMADKIVTLETLQASLTALEGKILTEARIKELVTEGSGTAATSAIATWAGSEAGKKIIGAESSRITAEALANVGTQPAKPAPAGTPAAEVKKTFAEIVQANIAGGKTKSEAITAAVESHPAEYKEYLKTGGNL